ncbi:MAG: N-acetyl-gamma-glutamyl-phosphate reductase [Alphaproteobacteria bacterium]|nr:N-acetyl-gamma-glutamyl-phosphate reductase [Alphaproteobacteria bacterium]
MQQDKNIRIAILGASGYTGAELLRFLLRHPHAEIVALTAEKNAGQPIGAVLPHLVFENLPTLVKIDAVDWKNVDLVFCCLPHGTTQDVIAALPEHLKVIDLSADFRLADVETYAATYGHAHRAIELQKSAVYGLTEIYRDAIKKARLVANPGCYPTSAQLPLYPLLKAKLISQDDIIIDSKSGVTGAGREAKVGSLFCEVTEGIHAYGIANHRHAPEIEQGLSDAVGAPVTVNFTPHLMPMSRGILSSIYVKLAAQKTAQDLHKALEQFYAGEAFVKVLPFGSVPATRHVRGSNLCVMGVAADRLSGRAIIIAAEDNLVKGASGQAVQNMNAMFDLPETTGLNALAVFP